MRVTDRSPELRHLRRISPSTAVTRFDLLGCYNHSDFFTSLAKKIEFLLSCASSYKTKIYTYQGFSQTISYNVNYDLLSTMLFMFFCFVFLYRIFKTSHKQAPLLNKLFDISLLLKKINISFHLLIKNCSGVPLIQENPTLSPINI